MAHDSDRAGKEFRRALDTRGPVQGVGGRPNPVRTSDVMRPTTSRQRWRSRLGGDLEDNAAVRTDVLADAVPLLPRLQFCFLDRVHLEESLKFYLIAPEGTSTKPTN